MSRIARSAARAHVSLLIGIVLGLPSPGVAQQAGLPAEPEGQRRPGIELSRDELFGRLVARGSYEIRSLATDSVLGAEDWELYEDETGFRTLRGTTSLAVDGTTTSRTASVTVNPELEFVEADVGFTAGSLEAYATYRRAGDVLSVEAFSGTSGETRQEVRFPEGAVFASQLFATRGWELAPFGADADEARPVYLAGSAPGVLVGEVKSLRAELEGREEVALPAGRFKALRFTVPLLEDLTPLGSPPPEGTRDAWWVLPGSHVPVAAELPSLGVRLMLVTYEPNPEPAGPPALHGPVLARGVFHHRPLRRTEPLATESWILTGSPEGGYLLRSELTYADGRGLSALAFADSLFQLFEIQARRRMGRSGESLTWKVTGTELAAEARGGGVGVVRQRYEVEGPPALRLELAALEGWAVRENARDSVVTYWMPSGPHPLGVLLRLPADVDLGAERLTTPARTFTVRRYASPAQTPALLRTIRWIFPPYHLAARVLFPALGREAILTVYETPEE